MSDWSETIGNFENLTNDKCKTEMSRALYATIVKQKDNFVEQAGYDDNPFYMYETLRQLLHPPKKDDPKHTYRGLKKKKGVKGPGEMADLPMKKFANIPTDLKNGLTYLLNKYIYEIHECYTSNEYKFESEDQVISQIVEYSSNTIINPFVPFVVRASSAFKAELLVEGNYFNLPKALNEKIRTYFKTEEDTYPERQLNVIVDVFVKFLKVLAINFTSHLFHKRCTLSKEFLLSHLQTLNSLLAGSRCDLDYQFFAELAEYIDVKRPPKKGKKKKDEDISSDEEVSESEDDSEEEKKKKSKKKAPKKETKKPRGRPPKSPSKEEKSDEEEEGEKDEEDGKFSFKEENDNLYDGNWQDDGEDD